MLEEHIKKAYNESAKGKRKGDKHIEVEKIREYILSAENIIIPNWDEKKLKSINKILKEFGLPKAKGLKIHTNAADLTRMPSPHGSGHNRRRPHNSKGSTRRSRLWFNANNNGP